MQTIYEKPSEQSLYIWNILGSMANALLSVVLLMLITRVLDDKQADIFSVAWTISQLMATVGMFQIRTYQATDVGENFKFWQYLVFRILTIILMMASSLVYVGVKGYSGYKSLIVLLVCLFKAVDAFADVYEGWFQQKERLDLSGKALTYRIIVATFGFGLTLLFTKDLILPCVVLVLSYIFCFFIYDVRYCFAVNVWKKKEERTKGVRWIIRLTMESLPLFINAFFMMSIINAPKMAIDKAIEQGQMSQGLQTIFNILFMPASVLTLAYIVFRPMLTRMAIMWSNGKAKAFLAILAKIGICLLGIGIVVLAGSAILGIPVLSLLYAVELSDYTAHLLVLVLGGFMYTFASVLDNALVVIRRQHVLVIAYTLTWIYIKVIVGIMLEKWGFMGASLSYATAMGVFLLTVSVMFVICFRQACSENVKSDKGESNEKIQQESSL